MKSFSFIYTRILPASLVVLFLFFPVSPLFSEESQSIIPPKKWFDSNDNKPYEKIIVSKKDISFAKYKIIGEIQVQVSKFHPTYQDEALKKLKLYALSMNGDAVIFVNFSEESDFSTSNQMLAKGTVVQFE